MRTIHGSWNDPRPLDSLCGTQTILSTFRLDQVWIRVVGLPLQLWSQKVFREIGNLCGGWIRTEEETELRNHLKWARMKVRGDSDSVPKSVELVHEGLTFKVTIWVEMPVKVVADGHSKIPLKTQRSDEGTVGIQDESLLGFTEVTGHVGSSFDPKILNWPAVSARAKARVVEVPLPTTLKKTDAAVKKKNLGPDLQAQFVSIGLVSKPSSFLFDPISAELEANNSNSYITLNCGEGEEAEHNREETEEEYFPENSKEEEVRVTENPQTLEDSAMQVTAILRSEDNISGLTTIEDAVPLNQHSPGEGEDSDFDIPIWIH
uniref:Uncharacterized protein n=1 Tax=Solanum tuberosum TaxID=4113 RepID=M1DPK7_SOLTU